MVAEYDYNIDPSGEDGRDFWDHRAVLEVAKDVAEANLGDLLDHLHEGAHHEMLDSLLN